MGRKFVLQKFSPSLFSPSLVGGLESLSSELNGVDSYKKGVALGLLYKVGKC